MKIDFANAMRAAAKLTRSEKLVEATRVIQAALSGKYVETEQQNAATPGESRTGEAGGVRPRKPLADVIDTLRRAKRNLNLEIPARKAERALEIPGGAQFLSGSFAGAAGHRAYRLYVPSHHNGRAPLIVMLHGCKQEPVDFAIGTRMNSVAEERGFFVLYPGQPKGANPMACWNWFNPQDQVRHSGEPSIIAGMTRQIIEQYNIDPTRVFVAGLSAGGAMAAVMGATYPDLYAAIGVHSGLAYRSANDVVSAFAAMRGEPGTTAAAGAAPVRTIVFHGDADETVHPSNAAKIIRAHFHQSGIVEHLDSAHPDYVRILSRDEHGKVWGEQWLVRGIHHGWSGGSSEGSFTAPSGPDASREIARFFLDGTSEARAAGTFSAQLTLG